MPLSDQSVKTPCIGVCSTGIGDSVCRGCKRFCHEVIDWNSYSSAQKRVVDERLSGFLSQVVSSKLRVIDAELLKWQMDTQNVRFVAHHDEHCWVFSLLKAGAGQIENPEDYGFELDLRFRQMTLAEVRDLIDQEFFMLSEAHYERYMMTPDLFRDQSR
ncbi:MAG: DUF1289 domain-containing protein [Halieaceae bacterium]|jgi:hypothetical protein|nr:DUF1289 domain-containing protein [Halieaceae bacterium]MCP4466314.1 DUF1289 domain-containing protein [Halieaceae bacterium]MCP4840803.1 DUF1289 domain-containing protein [Halieaceae bacterium]MDG2412324.1 DUF1289 domain-containing protein [Halioglobus sp.]